MKNVLFIVTEYNSANGICAKCLIDCLIDRSFGVYCITNKEPHYSNPLNERCNYSFVKPRLSYRLLTKANKKSGIKSKILKLLAFMTNKISLILSIPRWPLISRSYSNRLYKAAKKICDSSSIDFVVAVYSQIDTLVAASKLKTIHPSIKYIPYMLDSLAGGYGPKMFSEQWKIRRCTKWEKLLFINADKIVMMQSSKSFYDGIRETDYYDRIVFLDIPLMVRPNQIAKELKDSASIIRIVYVGSIPLKIRNPKYFIDCFKAVDNKNILLSFYGTCDDNARFKEMIKEIDNIKFVSQVSREKVNELLFEADFLLNIGNCNKNMVPSKIFEYMSYGKPIISVSPIHNEPSEKYLRDYNNCIILNEYDDISVSTERLKEFLRTNIGLSLRFEEIEKIFRLNKPESFLSLIEVLLND